MVHVGRELRNRELLALIAREKPDSLTELTTLAGRNKSNLSRTLKTMSRYGLVESRWMIALLFLRLEMYT